MIWTMLAMAAIILAVPSILVCIRNWKIVWTSVILSGITLAYLVTTLPPHNQK